MAKGGFSIYQNKLNIVHYENDQKYAQTFILGCSAYAHSAVSYTHLDVYKRQYCWVTTEFPHRIVALCTLANDSIKTKLISSNDKNRL